MPELVGAGLSVIRRPAITVDIITKEPESGLTVVAGLPIVDLVGYEAEVRADNPVAYWRLGEASGTVAVDEIGVLGVNGTYVNAPTLGVTGIPSESDTAVTFVAADGHRVNSCGTDNSFNFIHQTAVFTIEAWVKVNSSVTRAIMGNCETGASASTVGFLLVNNVNKALQIQVPRAVSGDQVLNFSSPNNALNGIGYQHCVVASDGVTATMYIDGVSVATQAVGSLGTGAATEYLSIAMSGFQAWQYGGEIDEVAIYDTALSAARVTAHRNAGLGI